jgi:hypothetical protein
MKGVPVCAFCRRSYGVTFAMFSPRFPPFGTACSDCERDLPAGTTVPGTPEDRARLERRELSP